MRQVRTCDFCDGEAAGTFEVVRPEDDPSGEGRRMVLCSGCRDTLASVLEPLAGGAAGGDTAAGAGSGPTTVVAEPDRGSGDGTDDDASDGQRSASSGSGDPEPGPEPGPRVDGTSSASEATADAGDAGDPAGGDDGSVADREPDLEEAFESSEGGKGTDGRPPSQRRGTPRGYRKVMRFLENRDFPMDREEAETLAAEAYGMDPRAVSAAIDHAVKHNRLREVSGELRR